MYEYDVDKTIREQEAQERKRRCGWSRRWAAADAAAGVGRVAARLARGRAWQRRPGGRCVPGPRAQVPAPERRVGRAGVRAPAGPAAAAAPCAAGLTLRRGCRLPLLQGVSI
jgi:hypothetical protein